MRLRLQSVEATYSVAESESHELMQSLDSLNAIWRKRIPDILEKWARLEQTDTPAKEWRTHSTLSRDLEQQLGKLQQDNKLGDSDRQDLVNVYAVIGSVQSLLDAISELGDSMKQINWRQWAIARF